MRNVVADTYRPNRLDADDNVCSRLALEIEEAQSCACASRPRSPETHIDIESDL
jgi:hypothetical protein